MATFRTDLFELNLIEAAADDATIVEFTGSTAGGTGGSAGKSSETDFFIQGAECVSKNFNASGVGGYGYEAAASWTVPADGANYIWTYWAAPNSVSNKVNGGYQIHIGNTTANYRRFYVDGSDSQLYGGWRCYPVNYASSGNTGNTLDEGTPNGTNQVLGYAVNNLTNISKGNPFGMDAMRYGRGTIALSSEDASPPASFSNLASYNDRNLDATINPPTAGQRVINNGFHRLGIFSLQNGVYQMQGRILFGSGSAPITTEAGGLQSASPITWDDGNVTIIIQPSQFCSANFNAFEVQNTSSSVTWTGVFVASLAPTAKGNFIVTDNATVALNGCTFTSCGFFTFNGGTNPNTITDCTFNSCGLITVGGATITNCSINATVNATPVSAVACLSSELSNITGTTFDRTQSGNYAAVRITDTIEIDTEVTWDGNTLLGLWTGGVTGTGVSSTAGGAIEVVTNAVLTIFVVNGATIPTVEFTGTGSVNVVAAVTVTISGLLGNTEVSVLQNPSPYSSSVAAPVTLFDEDVLSAVTGTDIQLVTTATNITSIGSSSTDFTTMNLVGGDQVRVSQRSNLKIFDTYTVVGTPIASAITVTPVASSTSKLPAIIDSPGETVTVEKVDASYTFSVSTGEVVDILAFRVGSLPIYQLNQTISSTNNSFPLSQVVDRNFDAFEV